MEEAVHTLSAQVEQTLKSRRVIATRLEAMEGGTPAISAEMNEPSTSETGSSPFVFAFEQELIFLVGVQEVS